MPIEDADRLHSKGSENKINILGFRISLIMLMVIIGGGVAAIFLLIAAFMMMSPATPINTTQDIPVKNIAFNVITTNYNYKIIKLTYVSNTTPIQNVQTDVLLSIDPPPSLHYSQRQSVKNSTVMTSFDNQLNTMYVYTGIDNTFHVSYDIPKYSDCVDFINGNWSFNIDDNATKQNLYTFKFSTTDSKTILIEDGMSINESLRTIPDYSTLFIYGTLYKERLAVMKPVRLIGMSSPVIDAGGYGADITIHSNNNVISGLTLINSGIKDYSDGGIVILPGSSGNILTQNTIYKTIYGIWMYQSNTNTIINNTIHDNDKSGIMLVGSSSNSITKNTVYNTIDGIHVDFGSDYNIIRENNVHDNKGYGIVIEKYSSLHNTCEYNTYAGNPMSCSDSIDRDANPNPLTQTTSIVTPVETITSGDFWNDCNGDPKCYQSQK